MTTTATEMHMILAILLLAWPAPTQPVRSDRVIGSVESLATGAPQREYCAAARVGRLSRNPRPSDELPGDRSRAIVEDEKVESDDTKVFGTDVCFCTVADPVPFQGQSLLSCEPSLLTGSPPRVLALRC
jgi:hypothetical protein